MFNHPWRYEALSNLKNLAVIAVILLGTITIYTYLISKENETSQGLSFIEDFRQVDDYPLYVARYVGDYRFDEYLETGIRPRLGSFGCTCFAVGSIVGRNFDFPPNPVLLLFTDPVDGYKSVSMVDLGYFDYGMGDLPVDACGLEETPYMPFDGMNEKGLVVTMAAVPSAESPSGNKRSVGEIAAIRLLLDYAATVDEAVELLSGVNVVMADPPIHYLVSDASGESAVVEFVGGEMNVYRSTEFGIITNFILTGVDLPGDSPCYRYDLVYRGLSDNVVVSLEVAWGLLEGSSQPSTIWSCVYDKENLSVHVVMGGKYGSVHTFSLDS